MNENKPPSEEFLTAGETSKLLHISQNTLRKWADEGKITTFRAGGKGSHRRYKIDNTSKEAIAPIPTASSERRKIIYARVSTKKQSENLSRQIEYLRDKYPNHELISDIGSGINFKRKGLNAILDSAFKGNLEEVVVAYKDRLCRFGFELFKTIFTKLSNATIVVFNENIGSQDEELASDVLEIVTVFSAKINGRKKYKSQPSPINNDENKVVPNQ